MEIEKNDAVETEVAAEVAEETVEQTVEEAVEEVKEEVAKETVEETAAPEEQPAEEAEAPASEETPAERPERADRPQGGRPAPRGGNRKRRKVCYFCAEKIAEIDFKDTTLLRKYISERAKILPRRVSGTCAKHQRQLTTAIKRARHMSLLPYISD
ncbi:MAG: 30S ribosomal protein S18 [Clostridia bacterium]|nr:30S ribosomal protein S18 [Clostridia bacterium]